jgi:Holliday junction resolvase-like predicted endonuclease
MLLELDIIEAVCEELEKHGYTVVSRKSGNRHSGVDVIAKKEKLRIFVEAVGETSSDPRSKKYGEPFDSSQVKVHIAELLLDCAQNFSTTKIAGYEYKLAIAIPDNEIHRRIIDNIRNFLEVNNIAVFFIERGKYVKFECKAWSLS